MSALAAGGAVPNMSLETGQSERTEGKSNSLSVTECFKRAYVQHLIERVSAASCSACFCLLAGRRGHSFMGSAVGGLMTASAYGWWCGLRHVWPFGLWQNESKTLNGCTWNFPKLSQEGQIWPLPSQQGPIEHTDIRVIVIIIAIIATFSISIIAIVINNRRCQQ